MRDLAQAHGHERDRVARSAERAARDGEPQLAARELAVKQGMGVVLSGVIDRQGSGYGVSVKASQTVTGNSIEIDSIDVTASLSDPPGFRLNEIVIDGNCPEWFTASGVLFST